MADGAATTRIPAAALTLGLAGLVPFAACAVAQILDLPQLPAVHAQFMGLAYGAVILSFLGGIRWGHAMGNAGHCRTALELGGSVLPALAGWAALLLPPVPALSLLAAGFLVQALWDVIATDSGLLPRWFGKLRMILTVGAVLSLLVMLAAALI